MKIIKYTPMYRIEIYNVWGKQVEYSDETKMEKIK